ncbi:MULTISPECIES: ABC transporter ATP-binding protein [Chromohalobacter]|uniref:ABC transporter ATP-binding protein n=1 Tax=Chromohalobacter TaxID=42054 RepID=UPI0015C4AAEC|nr:MULTISPECIES: ABC transporter ATP-binding protein [Chromohalobacter]MDO0946412.1 ABC transporter ATP-binding protein [Chromohalobacter salexigens]NQY46208.1 ABC transporter ATP-binding protein [Chromohalobacter sp.]NWO56847.1 ABC transporter ATP-binding protein [Chromohalobacter salexigens]
MAEITLKSLAHSYSKNPATAQDYAIREMNHVWHQGGAYALLGPSGCGKSTMLNIISGLLEPSNGEVLFDGKVVNSLPPEERNIAQVFQFPVIYDTMTVYDNLAFPLRNMKTPEARVHERVMEVADVLELTPQLKRKAKNLNADEKQKVSMGRGLVRDDVSAILFDEPLTVIDPQLKWKLRRKLKEIHHRFRITMVYVTHDQLEASTFADKIAVMYEGQVVQFGTPRELFETPNHTFVGYFIGSPGMNFLDVTVRDGKVFSGEAPLLVDKRVHDGIARATSDNVKLGIRPEFIEVHQEPVEDGMEVKVEHAQDLGTYSIVYASLGGISLKARVEEDQITPVDKAWLRFPSEKIGLYVDDFRVELPHE